MVWVAFDTSKGEAQPEAIEKASNFLRSDLPVMISLGFVWSKLPFVQGVPGVPHRGNKVTEVEKQTLRWVAENLDLTEKGRAFLQQQLNDGHLTDVLGEFILWIL